MTDPGVQATMLRFSRMEASALGVWTAHDLKAGDVC